jgi:hypothetical protein
MPRKLFRGQQLETTMKRLIVFTLAIGLAGVFGCETKSGSAPSTNPNKPNETRKLSLTAADSHSITQDKIVELMVHINRENFKDPVTIEVNELPKGVMLETKDLTIPADKTDITLTLKAAPDALPVNDQVFHIVAKAGDIKTEPKPVKLTVKAK